MGTMRSKYLAILVICKYTIENFGEYDFRKILPSSNKFSLISTTFFSYRLFFLRSIAQFFTQIYMNCFVSS